MNATNNFYTTLIIPWKLPGKKVVFSPVPSRVLGQSSLLPLWSRRLCWRSFVPITERYPWTSLKNKEYLIIIRKQINMASSIREKQIGKHNFSHSSDIHWHNLYIFVTLACSKVCTCCWNFFRDRWHNTLGVIFRPCGRINVKHRGLESTRHTVNSTRVSSWPKSKKKHCFKLSIMSLIGLYAVGFFYIYTVI